MARPKVWLTGGLGLVLAIAAAKLLLHLGTASRHGYFGDELYFLACGEHLDWGYVDQPPLVGLVAWIVRHTLGTSLLAIRSVSALAGAALVVLTGLLARDLGGGRFAMGLSGLASGFAFVLSSRSGRRPGTGADPVTTGPLEATSRPSTKALITSCRGTMPVPWTTPRSRA